MKIFITICFLSLTILGDSKMLKINSFESMIHQFDQAKDTEELMILHQHFYKFLHENFLSHKDLGDAELTRMSEYFTATKLSLLILMRCIIVQVKQM